MDSRYINPPIYTLLRKPLLYTYIPSLFTRLYIMSPPYTHPRFFIFFRLDCTLHFIRRFPVNCLFISLIFFAAFTVPSRGFHISCESPHESFVDHLSLDTRCSPTLFLPHLHSIIPSNQSSCSSSESSFYINIYINCQSSRNKAGHFQ